MKVSNRESTNKGVDLTSRIMLQYVTVLHDSTYQTGQLSNTYTLTKKNLACGSASKPCTPGEHQNSW